MYHEACKMILEFTNVRSLSKAKKIITNWEREFGNILAVKVGIDKNDSGSVDHFFVFENHFILFFSRDIDENAYPDLWSKTDFIKELKI